MHRPLITNLNKILGWLLPTYCVFCGKLGAMLCDACKQDLPWHKNGCPICGNVLTSETSDKTCGQCLTKPPAFDRTFTMFSYQDPITKLITGLKFQHKLSYGKLLGELLCQYLLQNREQKNLPECLIPVPLHKSRIKQRGFNQALEITRPIAERLSIPINTSLCERIRPTLAQTTLPAKKRQKNIKGAFAITKRMPYKHVAIIDDVVTTGHTSAELSSLLRQHGVSNIEVWCCAHAFM